MVKMHITGSVEVWHGYAKQIGDNGERDDACVRCWQAPQVGVAGQWVYLTTNGDPVLVGWLEDDGASPATLELDPDVREWWHASGNEWLRDLVGQQYGEVV